MTPKEYLLDFAEDVAPAATDEREIEAYYARTAPPGAPPLAVVREHVIAAFARSTRPAAVQPLALPLLYALGKLLPTKVSDLVGVRYWPSTEAVAHLSQMRAELAEAIAAADVRAQIDAELSAAIASVGAPVRLVVRQRAISFDEQIAALASAGVVVREGTPRSALTYNYDERLWAARPYQCLADFIDHSDDMCAIAARCLEDPEDDAAIYAAIVRRLAAMARLPITNVVSHADFAAQSVTLSFELAGTTHRPQLAWNGAYIDTTVFRVIDELARPRGLYVLPGADYVVIATDEAGALRLRAAGAPFERVS